MLGFSTHFFKDFLVHFLRYFQYHKEAILLPLEFQKLFKILVVESLYNINIHLLK